MGQRPKTRINFLTLKKNIRQVFVRQLRFFMKVVMVRVFWMMLCKCTWSNKLMNLLNLSSSPEQKVRWFCQVLIGSLETVIKIYIWFCFIITLSLCKALIYWKNLMLLICQFYRYEADHTSASQLPIYLYKKIELII